MALNQSWGQKHLAFFGHIFSIPVQKLNFVIAIADNFTNHA